MDRFTLAGKIAGLAAEAAAVDPKISEQLYALCGAAALPAAKDQEPPRLPLRRETISGPRVDSDGNCNGFGGSSVGLLCGGDE